MSRMDCNISNKGKFMKYLIIILPLLLNAWSFTKADLDNLTYEQRYNLAVSYAVGYQDNQALDLATTSIVETRASVRNDTNPNHICGVHQINIKFSQYTCEELEEDVHLSAKEALNNLNFWKRKYPNSTRAERFGYYNGGDVYPNPHKQEYLRRFNMVYKVLKNNY